MSGIDTVWKITESPNSPGRANGREHWLRQLFWGYIFRSRKIALRGHPCMITGRADMHHLNRFTFCKFFSSYVVC
jgi:hypothetical protein